MEKPALALCAELGSATVCGLEETIAPDGGSLRRRDHIEVKPAAASPVAMGKVSRSNGFRARSLARCSTSASLFQEDPAARPEPGASGWIWCHLAE
jgi:hypothetical protein